MKKLALYKCFNPRTHTGCDSLKLSFTLSLPKFQSTHPHGVRLIRSFKKTWMTVFQSTHPHGVRQSLRPSATLFHVVSIHAPTRGATSHDCYSPFSVSCFNPRTHTGCDLVVLTSSNNLIIVSIHAPTRGATFVYRGTDRPQFCRFNPRTHTGCDVM